MRMYVHSMGMNWKLSECEHCVRSLFSIGIINACTKVAPSKHSMAASASGHLGKQ